MSNDTIRTYLAENPRMIGVLFTLTVLLSQAGSVAGNCGTAICGP